MYCKPAELRLQGRCRPSASSTEQTKTGSQANATPTLMANIGRNLAAFGAMEAFQTRLQLRLQAATTVSESNMPKELTAIIEREGNGYVALCPELDVVSQGDTVIEARSNVREALELFLETASETEIEQRFRS